jgi:hypothetical protein
MQTKELLKALNLKLMSQDTRIKDLEQQVASLRMQLAQQKQLLTEAKS